MAAPNILCDTAGMTNAQWLAARMHGPSGKIPYTVGGSDVAAVFGVSPWTTPLELWMIKKGRMKPPAKSNANQLEMGHLLEPIAAHWYAKKTGNRVYEDTNLYQHADHPYALANFDRRFERASDGEPGILECKSCTYLGWMISGKFRSTYHSTGQKGSRPAPKEEWIVTKGTHEPIVTKELFDQVQLYFQSLKEELGRAAVYDSKSKKASIFKGHLRCGECGQAMFLRNKKNHAGERVPWYYCSLHENYNSSYCIKKAVKKQDVEDIALKLIRTQIKLFTDARELLTALNKKESSKTKFRIYSDQIRGVKKQIDRYVSLKASLYEEFANGTLSQNDYISMGQEYAAKADELRIFLAELEKECQKYNPSFAASGSWAELIEQYKDADTLTAEMVDAFIDEMILYNNGHVEVKFNFRNELDEVIHLAAIRQREVERYAM